MLSSINHNGEMIEIDKSKSPTQATTPKKSELLSSYCSVSATKKKLDMSCEKDTPVKDVVPVKHLECVNDTLPVKDPTDGTLPERSYSGKKRGRKIGDGKKLKITVAEWWDVCCDWYQKLKIKMNQAAFLRSTKTSEKFTGTKSQQQSFRKFLKKYDNEPLWRPSKKFKTHKRHFVPLEEKLINI